MRSTDVKVPPAFKVFEKPKIQKEKFDWKAYLIELEKMGPFLTDEDVKDMGKAREAGNTPRFPDW